MAFFSDIRTALDALCTVVGEDVEATTIPSMMQRLDDEALVALIESATALVRGGEALRIAATGAIAARSTRDAGHGGLAQKRGHRSTVSLIQDLTGTSRADATRHLRLGEALAVGLGGTPADASEPDPNPALDAAGADAGGADAAASIPGEAPARPWHAVLGDALMAKTLTSAQHDAIYRGLGEPPLESETAWETAAAQLIDEAAVRTPEELTAAARAVRDLLDPAGAQERFAARFEGRSFRAWTDRDGIRRGTFAFDDEGAAWVEAIVATALRPRRGGPRFVDSEEKARAEELVADPRTNDQLAYDLMMDVLRAGALADAASVFGTRQAGVRIVATAPALAEVLEGRPAVGLLEDSDATVPDWLIATRTCDVGTVTVIRDEYGNPLDLGREARLYTGKQRLALAVRDGGCRIPGCDRPASYCEAHHIDPYSEGGCTDIDRGILLCRFHHMNLHHHGWRITREGKGEFVLHRPGLPALVLTMRLPRRYAFGDLAPPPRRFRPAA